MDPTQIREELETLKQTVFSSFNELFNLKTKDEKVFKFLYFRI
jgi:hypothetical protein